MNLASFRARFCFREIHYIRSRPYRLILGFIKFLKNVFINIVANGFRLGINTTLIISKKKIPKKLTFAIGNRGREGKKGQKNGAPIFAVTRPPAILGT